MPACETAERSPACGRPATAKLRNPRRGLWMMFLGLALFSIMNGIVKAQADVFPINQIVFFRNAGGAVALVLILATSGYLGALKARHRPLNLLQMLVMTCGLLLTFAAFHLIPLADVMAIGFAQPIVIALASLVFLGERINGYGWAAVVLGLIGVQLVIMPSGGAFALGAVTAGAGTICSAASMMLQRTLTCHQTPLFITVSFMAISAILLAPSLLVWWQTPTMWQLAGLVGMGLLSGPLQLLMVNALYHASAATVAPMSYTNMLWAVLIGYVWFGDVPAVPVLAGSVVVIAATALLVRSVPKADTTSVQAQDGAGTVASPIADASHAVCRESGAEIPLSGRRHDGDPCNRNPE